MNDDDMVLYSLGYELGKDMKQQQLELNQQIILQGIKDALAGSEPMFGIEVQRQAIASLQAQRAERNLRIAETFLAQNKNKAGVKTLPSGLQYKIITSGEGRIPGSEDTVMVEYRGTLIDGTEFTSSSSRGQPAKLKVSNTIKGLSEALQLMPTGSKWELYIHPELAYGKRSPGKAVPANSGLIYEIELLSVE
jgi:FKBP-type peptidyl-prolyl cis-trans isomerase FklB